MGLDSTDLKEIRILNRTVRWTKAGIECLGDDSKGSDIPLPKEYEAAEGDAELDELQAKEYRRIAMVVNYLALDQPDVQFASGVLGRTAVKPTERSWANLKRYLVKHPRVVFHYRPCESRLVTAIGPGARSAAGV